MKALIIEDEKAAVRNLMALLGEVDPDIEVIDVLDSITDSVEWFQSHPMPELIFLDIHLADGSAFEIFGHVDISCPVIFTTAYDEYALKAFKVNSVDYLLKPFEFQDLLKAADKARRQFEYRLLEQQGEIGNASQIKGDSLFVKSDYRVVRIDVKNILYIEGMSEYVRIFVEGEDKPVITLASLQKMEERLPTHFMRVHRSYIVNLRKITEVSRLRIIFDKNTYIPVGDNYKEKFTEYIGKLSLS